MEREKGTINDMNNEILTGEAVDIGKRGGDGAKEERNDVEDNVFKFSSPASVAIVGPTLSGEYTVLIKKKGGWGEMTFF